MKLQFLRNRYAEDAMQADPASPVDARDYNEWHHFTFSDARTNQRGIVNLAVSGNTQIARGRAAVTLVVHDFEHGWTGTMNVFEMGDVWFQKGRVNLAIGNNSLQLDESGYRVRAELKDRSIRLDATWVPRADAVRIEQMGGFINTFLIPSLDVTGEITIGGHTSVLRGAAGYHDHNWGSWDWRRDLGWNWGYVLAPNGNAQKRVSIVFGQVTDAGRLSKRTDLVLLLWKGRALTHVFMDRSVALVTSGRLDSDVPRVPGIMALLHFGSRESVPAELMVTAADGFDHLNIHCAVRHAMQFLIPHGAGSAHTVVSELAGEYAVDGILDGEVLRFSASAFAELAGAARTMQLPTIAIG